MMPQKKTEKQASVEASVRHLAASEHMSLDAAVVTGLSFEGDFLVKSCLFHLPPARIQLH